jgi:hypothetical protein
MGLRHFDEAPQAVPRLGSSRSDGVSSARKRDAGAVARPTAAILAGISVSLGVYAASGRASALGLETSVVSGATISNVHYRLDETQPSQIDALAFSIRPALRHGRVSVRAAGHGYPCRLSHAGTRALCPTTSPQLAVRELTTLGIVAAQ